MTEVTLRQSVIPTTEPKSTLTSRERVLINMTMAFSGSSDREVDFVFCNGAGVNVRLLWSEKFHSYIMGPEVTFEEAGCMSDIDEQHAVTPKGELTRRFNLFDFENDEEFFETVANNWLSMIEGKDKSNAIEYSYIDQVRKALESKEKVILNKSSYMMEHEGRFTNKDTYHEYNPKTKTFSRMEVVNGRKSTLDELIYNSDEQQDLGHGLNEVFKHVFSDSLTKRANGEYLRNMNRHLRQSVEN